MKSDKTLLEILVDELPKRGGWPEGADHAVQDYDSEIKFHNSPHCLKFELNRAGIWGSHPERAWKFMGRHFEIDFLSSDYKTAIITRDQYEAAIAEKGICKIPVDSKVVDDEGWIKWDGGECPVEKGTLVDVKHRDGDLGFGQPAGMNGYADRGRATAEDWSHDGRGGDIIAYRLSKPEDVEQVDDSGVFASGCSTDCKSTIESLTDAIIEYGCEANLAYPLAKHLLSKGFFK